MKKAVMMIIGVIYLASIVVISIFGMRSVVHNEIIPVTKIECLNQTNEKYEVQILDDGTKLIKVKFTTPADITNMEGTMLQIDWKVYPDNATNKDIKFEYDRKTTRASIATDEGGNEVGLFLFTGKVILYDVKIIATDGSKIFDKVTIWAY